MIWYRLFGITFGSAYALNEAKGGIVQDMRLICVVTTMRLNMRFHLIWGKKRREILTKRDIHPVRLSKISGKKV